MNKLYIKFFLNFIISLYLLNTFISSHILAADTKAPTLKLSDPLPANLFTELARVINPAVVNISTALDMKQRRANDPFLELLERFYGRPNNQINPLQERQQAALGTGFIIREDGLIITNNHVIDGADIVTVQLNENDEKTYDAKVIGRDPRTDLALIKINAGKKLPVAVLGSSKDLEVGEWVAAFGNPFGHGHTMTKGIISAKGRDLSDINRFPFIQTDASINPGNSGGPLVNSKGLVVGVNSAIDPRAQGIGFAIPIDEVKTIIDQLEKNGKVKTGFIGVGLGFLNPKAAQHLGIKKDEGVIITDVNKNTPAAKAGIEVYDVVLEFNGKKIKTEADFMNAVAGAEIGQKSKLKILRQNKELNLDITIEERPSEKIIASPAESKFKGQTAPYDLGFTLTNIDGKIVNAWGINESLTGLPIVVSVESNKIAALSGLRPGDVIFDVNKKRIRSTQEAIKNLSNGTNTLRIMRGDGMGFIVFDGKQ